MKLFPESCILECASSRGFNKNLKEAAGLSRVTKYINKGFERNFL